MRVFSTIAVTLFFAVGVSWLPEAKATPPECHTAYLNPICTTSSKVVWFLELSTNCGSHYVEKCRYAWAVLDVSKGKWIVEPITDVVSTGLASEPKTELKKLSGKHLNALLSEMGVLHCPPNSQNALYRFSYSTKKENLYVHLDDATQVVGKIPHYDNTFELSATLSACDWHLARRKISCEEPSKGKCRVLPKSEFLVGENTVLVFYLNLKMDWCSEYDLVFSFSTEKLNAARSKLLNVVGHRHYKHKMYKKAGRMFQTALYYNRENRTARYNLACVLALQSDVAGSVAALGGLEKQPGLKKKVENDKDFDGIRQDPEFKVFVETLPE